MDISHFGLFDLAARRPAWTDRPETVPAAGVGLVRPLPAQTANDDAHAAGTRSWRVAPSGRAGIDRSPLRLVGERGGERGPA